MNRFFWFEKGEEERGANEVGERMRISLGMRESRVARVDRRVVKKWVFEEVEMEEREEEG